MPESLGSAPSVRVVGLDLSLTATGVALPDGTLRTLKSALRGVERLRHLRGEVRSLVEYHAPGVIEPFYVDLVVIEGYSMGGQRGSAGVGQALGELGGVIRLLLFDLGVQYVDVAPASLKKYATGKGNASKDAVLVAAARRLDLDPADNNQADAAWLRAMALDHYGQPAVAMPAAHREALTKIAWPSLPATALGAAS